MTNKKPETPRAPADYPPEAHLKTVAPFDEPRRAEDEWLLEFDDWREGYANWKKREDRALKIAIGLAAFCAGIITGYIIPGILLAMRVI